MSLAHARIPVIGFIGPSGTGKTTLLRYVIGLLTEQGLRVGIVKQARADFDIDQPGKDSYELRKAGVESLLLGSEQQSALMVENSLQETDPELDKLLLLLDQDELDIVLVEGFAACSYPKIELCRRHGLAQKKPRYHYDTSVIAVACDSLPEDTDLPVFEIDDSWSITEFILTYLKPDPEISNYDSKCDSNPV